MSRAGAFAVLLSFIVATWSPPAAAEPNVVHDLGSFDGTTSRGVAINDQGVAVGWSSREAMTRPFRWTLQGGLELLDAPGLPVDINNVGTILFADGVLEGSTFTPYAGSCGLISGCLAAIDDDGVAVANSIIVQIPPGGGRSNVPVATLFKGSESVSLGSFSVVTSISKSGLLSGFGPSRGPFVVNGKSYSFPDVSAISAAVYRTNDKGEVLGTYRSDVLTRLFVLAGGTFTDLGVVSAFNAATTIVAVNDKRQMVLTTESPLGNPERLFFDPAVGLRTIEQYVPTESGLTITEIRDMNGVPQIIGTGSLNGIERAFVLDVNDLSPAYGLPTVPPSALFALVVGGCSTADSRSRGILKGTECSLLIYQADTQGAAVRNWPLFVEGRSSSRGRWVPIGLTFTRGTDQFQYLSFPAITKYVRVSAPLLSGQLIGSNTLTLKLRSR